MRKCAETMVMMLGLIKRALRAAAFVGKEIAEVRRQPRLVLSLILGPFLILFLFGIGYSGEQTKLRASIVVPTTGEYSRNVEDYRKLVGNQLSITDVTTDRQNALDRLKRQDVELVVVVPSDAARQIGEGTQATLQYFYNEVDPVRGSFITYSSYLYTTEINKQTVAAAASQGQESASDLRSILARLRTSLTAAESSMDRGDTAAANQQIRGMQGSSLSAQIAVALLGQVLNTNTTMLKPQNQADGETLNLTQGQEVTGRLNTDLRDLSTELDRPQPDRTRVRSQLAKVHKDVDDLDSITKQFQQINPLVLAAPFYAIAQNTAPVAVGFTSFYAPSVLVLLLQHIAITLAALSVVRERLLGTLELFRVSPIRPGEIMAGKYASFMLFLALLTAILLVLMSNELTVGGFRLSLGVPILGDWALLAASLALTMFASIGLGFLIATVSRSESQAVQLSMLVLLTSVFFSGFFLRLETLWGPVRAVSYALPVTYGIQALQVVMLRGGTPRPGYLVALLLLGAFFGLLSFVRFSSEFKRG